MDIKEAIKSRHSVRQYKDIPIPEDLIEKLCTLIDACNEQSGLRIQLITDDPGCFDSILGHYGKFKNVNNYIAIVGPKSLPDLDELSGYYGEQIVIAAQMMGLNTCWVAGTYSRSKCKCDREAGEKIVCVIALGYGETEGTKHRSKSVNEVCRVTVSDKPVWFRNGVRAAMMAPTAMNQQKFLIDMVEGEPVITAGRGPMSRIDLGIVKYNFEAASGHKCR